VLLTVLHAPAPARADARTDYERGLAAHDRGDVVAALPLLHSAAEQGHVKAMVRLAYLLDKAEENESAVRWYTRAAQAGDAEAALGLGTLYANGEGVPRDAALALRWITRAAQAGYGPALVTLAAIYRRGDLGVAASREQARHWLEQAVAAGYGPARTELERLQAPVPGAPGQPQGKR